MTKKRTIRFPEGNTIAYRQDFAGRRGIPHDVTFEIVTPYGGAKADGAWLRGPGYGGRPYGNGQLFVPREDNSQ